ncbi:PRD domain-containing protein [Erysipelotrichaceae bacterium 51-3]|uniref:PRD domain-containing protein n=1 Tax=Allobaculum sp. JKK-2023 TaxID=3108943 RepID=UPI002B059F7A|nr:PRD domain-containing protein [Allobaculum sp. JKK-2023]
MKVVRNINNNVAVCLDDQGHELIAIGKGIGFKKAPYEISLDQIDETYYNLDSHYKSLLTEISPEILELAMKITNKGQRYLGIQIKPAFVFALADHIHSCIKNAQAGLFVSNPMSNEIRHLYEREYRLGQWAVKMMEKAGKVKLPSSEAGNIALHFLNAAQSINEARKDDTERFVDDITDIIESEMNLIIDRNSLNYSRFVTHLKYVLKRSNAMDKENSENARMFDEMYEQYPNLQNSIQKIKTYMTGELGVEPSKEEMLYLMIHLNRLCSGEGL